MTSATISRPKQTSDAASDQANPIDAAALPRRRRLFTDWVVDLAGLGAALVIAAWGFATTFGGSSSLIAGVTGIVIGAGLALEFARRRWPLWVLVIAVLVAYLVVGGPLATPSLALAGVVPTPASIRSLIDALVSGWANLLTISPPVGRVSNLLAIPLFMGLASSALTFSIARRARRLTLLALLGPSALLVAAILFGTANPVSSLQGVAFVGVSVGWASYRQRYRRLGADSSARSPMELAFTAGFIGVAVAIALLVGSVPWVSNAENRFVLREQIEPPIELRNYPSPLESFRRYRIDLEEAVMFTSDQDSDGGRVRLATLDYYDGVVWHVTPVGLAGVSSRLFERVGEQVPSTVVGEPTTASFNIDSYDDVWIPTIGGTTGVQFAGDRSTELEDGFRYNIATDAAAVAAGIRRGDQIRVTANRPGPAEELVRVRPGSGPLQTQPPLTTPPAVVKWLERTGIGGDTPLQRVRNAAAFMRDNGYFSDGRIERGQEPSSPGHGNQRITSFLGTDNLIGNEEQYTSALSLVAAILGLPARVVVGFEPEDGTRDVRGGDITAWVEVASGDDGWIQLDPTPDASRTVVQRDQLPEPPPNPIQEAPPIPIPPPAAEQNSGEGESLCPGAPGCPDGFSIPAWLRIVVGVPLGALTLFAGFTLAVAGLKNRRRRIRRTTGEPWDQIAGGWEDLLDSARDLGEVVPPRATRREAAVLVAQPGIASVARDADRMIFGPQPPAVNDAAQFWETVDVTRHAMVQELSTFKRWQALVNLSSLAPSTSISQLARRMPWRSPR